MSNPNPFSQGKTFVLACSFLVLAATTASVLQLHQIYRVSRMTSALSERGLPSVTKSSELGESVLTLRKAQSEYVLASNEGTRVKIEKLIEQENQNLFIHRKFVEPLLRTNDEKILYDAFSKNLDEYVGLNEKIVGAVKAGNRDQAQAIFFQDSTGTYAKMIDGAKQLNAIAYGEGIATVSAIGEAQRISFGYSLGLIALSGMLGGLLFFGFRRLEESAQSRAAGVISIAKSPTPPASGSGEDTGKKAA